MGDGDIPWQRRLLRAQAEHQQVRIWRPAGAKIIRQEMRELRLAGLVVGDEQQVDHPAAGVAAGQIALQHLPGLSVFGSREQAVAVDRAPQGLRFAPQGMDDVMVVDDRHAMAIAATSRPCMGDDQGAAEKGLKAIVVKVDPQALPDQLLRGAVEDALDQKAAGAGDRNHGLGEVGGATGRQGLQMCAFRLNGGRPLPVAPRHQDVDEALVVLDAGEVAAAAQNQRLFWDSTAPFSCASPRLLRLASMP